MQGFRLGKTQWVLVVRSQQDTQPCRHQWSGCSVRIALQLRLPHSFHCPLSAMRASCAVRSTDVCSGLFLPGRLGLRASRLYRVMRASRSAVTPLPGCRTAGPTGPPSLGFGVVLTMKNAVGTSFGPVVTHIQQTGGGGVRAMRQRILGSHTPPCHRCMVITTLSSIFCLAGVRG